MFLSAVVVMVVVAGVEEDEAVGRAAAGVGTRSVQRFPINSYKPFEV